MAKIYETKEDMQRDVLDRQALEMRLRAEKQVTTGFSLAMLSQIPSAFGAPRWLNYVANLVGIVGLIDVVRSFFTHSKAHDLDLQRERLGPAHIGLPAEIASPAPSEECTPCKSQHREALKGKSLLEYAIKPVDPGANIMH